VADQLLTHHPSIGQEVRPVTYLRSAELARRWGTTTGALANLRYRGTGPDFVRIPGIGIRYSLDVIQRYEKAGR
jgi:hypothetical protein